MNISRTVGWFTSIFPVLLDLQDAGGPADSLKQVKEQLRKIPRRGIGFGILRYLGPERTAKRLQGLPQADLLFNYLGQMDVEPAERDGLFLSVDMPLAPERSAEMVRAHAVELNGVITGGRLQLALTYSKNLHRQETISRFAGGIVDALSLLIDH